MIIGRGISIGAGFLYSGTSSEYPPPTIDFLVVGGGGSGSITTGGGGGGAGGYVQGTCNPRLFGTSGKSVSLGIAGRQGNHPSKANADASIGPENASGGNSVFDAITAFGGGGGANGGSSVGVLYLNGAAGGCGGGGATGTSSIRAGATTQVSYATYSATGYGNIGGWQGGVTYGGTGGGAGAAPGGTSNDVASGISSSITGTSLEYCRGASGRVNLWSTAENRDNSGNGSPAGDTTSLYSGCSGIIVIAYSNIWADLSFVSSGLLCNGTYGNNVSDTSSRAGYKVYQFTAGSGTISFA